MKEFIPNGFVILARNICDKPLLSNPQYLKLWIYLLTNMHTREEAYTIGNTGITIEYGQYLRATRIISKDNEYMEGSRYKSWGHTKVHRMLKDLEANGSVTLKNLQNYGTLITVTNARKYADFENYRHRAETLDGTQLKRNWDKNKDYNNYKEKNTSRKKSNHQRQYSDAFEGLWKAYSRGPKWKADDEYRIALEAGVDAQMLMDAVKAYVTQEVRPDFKGEHLHRWIKNCRYEEYQEEVEDNRKIGGITLTYDLPHHLR